MRLLNIDDFYYELAQQDICNCRQLVCVGRSRSVDRAVGNLETGAFFLGRVNYKLFRPQTDYRFHLHDLNISGQIYLYDMYDLYDLYDLAHDAEWEPYNLHDLAQQ